MSKSATERFLNRSRPTVPPRVDEVSASLQSVTSTSTPSPDPMSSPPPPTIAEEPERIEKPPARKTSGNSGLRTLEEELASLPKVSNFMLRVEEQYKQQIQKVADKAGVTPETLLQGLWVVAQNKTGLLDEAIEEARKHHARRDRAKQLKPAITRAKRTMEKLGLG